MLRPGWAAVAVLLSAAISGCASTDQIVVSHRMVPKSEARIAVMPVALPATEKAGAAEGRTIASLYATELLRSYEVLDWERLERTLAAKNVPVDTLLSGAGPALAKDLGVDGLLVGEVYTWTPGKPGFWILAKKGRVGFQARLIDVASGSVLWSVNRVRDTEPKDSLPVGVSRVFRDLASEMPSKLTPY
jgi:hypothetical protein